MADTGYVIGIDMGTGSARAAVYDTTGEQLGFGSAKWETKHPRPGRAEQDTDEWWTCTVSAVQAAVKSSDVDAAKIRAISMDATSCTVVVLDADNRVLRPAIMWMDVRSVEETEEILATDDPALKYCGQGPVSAEWGLPKSMWLKKHEPEVFDQTAVICDQTDWLVFRLTGEWAMSVSHAAAKYFYDRDEGGWPLSLYRAVDAEDIMARYPSRVAQIGEKIGTLLPEVAEEFGLSPETLVIEGGIDAYLGAVGLGVAEPGRLALITGSSHVLTGQLAEPLHTRGLWGAFPDATVPGYYTIDGGQVSTGVLVEWFLRNLAAKTQKAVSEGAESPYDHLTEEASKIPIGSDGLIVLDHFQGNRAPYFDARSRGMFWGLTLAHTEAHMFRAILEGICFGTEAIFEVMRAEGVPLEEVVISGGATNNRLWLQMHADVSNIPIVLTNVSEGPVLGSAMVASVGAGFYPDIPTASRAMTSVRETIRPNPEAHEQYKFNYQAYKDSYQAMKELMQRVSKHYA